MSPHPFGYRWEITPQPISRLDYIATAIYAAYMANHHNFPDVEMSYRRAVREAINLIAELDKEQNHE